MLSRISNAYSTPTARCMSRSTSAPKTSRTGRILPVVRKAIEGTGIDTGQIWLEATERGLIDQDFSRTTLGRARHLGFTIAIDDFGTGYSSLSYLQSMPIDVLKIDKSFIDTIGTDSAKSSVTPYIIDMAKALNLKIVAEGIETKEQQAFLREHGVQFGQGGCSPRPSPRMNLSHSANVTAERSVTEAIFSLSPDKIVRGALTDNVDLSGVVEQRTSA